MAYGYTLTGSQAGQIVDSTLNLITSFAAEEVIQFGMPLMRGTIPDTQVRNFLSSPDFSTNFLGISGYTATEIKSNYPIADMVSVVEQGRVFIPLILGLTIIAGNNAYINKNSNVITNVSSTNQVAIGRFLTSGVSDGLTGVQLFALEIVPGFEI